MDQKLTAEEREKVLDDLADTMIAALGNGLITDDEAPNSSKYILATIDKVTTQSELEAFFQDICQRWKIYQTVYNKYKGQQAVKTDEVKIKVITSKLNQLIQN